MWRITSIKNHNNITNKIVLKVKVTVSNFDIICSWFFIDVSSLTTIVSSLFKTFS